MTLVFLLEELSMKVFLEGLLPKLLPAHIEYRLIPHEGKSDLEKSIPRKLRAWRDPSARFIVVRDQDSGDCEAIKQRLVALCARAGRPDTLVRIACRELEAWCIGDLEVVAMVFAQPGLSKLAAKRKYRSPDTMHKPSAELERLAVGYGKVAGARRMGAAIRLEGGRSHSFKVFVAGVRRLVEEATSGSAE